MPLRFRDRRKPASALTDIPEQSAEPVDQLVADDPPPIREASYHALPVQSQIVPLPAEDQWHHALAQLQSLLDELELSPSLARRWLSPAREVLVGGEAVELYVELDPPANLITVELWSDDGERLFGLDDYLPVAAG